MKLFSAFLLLQIFGVPLQAQLPKDSFYYSKITDPRTQMISVNNGKYKVFTQKIGQGSINLLLLHGGPGNTHEYFENFPENLKKVGVTVYYYDQLGSYFSDVPQDSSVWNINRFIEEVETVRKSLKLENFYLLGHSWGGMLAELYAAKYGGHLKGLILSNVPGFFAKDGNYLDSVINNIDKDVRYKTALLPKFSANKSQIDSISKNLPISDSILLVKLSKEYNKANDSIFSRTMYYHQAEKMPEPLKRSMRHIENDGIDKYNFNPFGADYQKALKTINIATLLLGGKYDFVKPENYLELKKIMTNAKVRVLICPNGAHFTMWDDTDNYFKAVTNFIEEVNTNTFDPGK